MPVNKKKRGRPRLEKGKLTPETIVQCAKSLLQANGKIPAIRLISGELGVDPMAIYHYFSNKAALLEALTVSLMEEIYAPKESEDWQEEVLQLSKSYLKLLAKYPGLLKTVLSMKTDGPAQVFTTRFKVAVRGLEMDEDKIMDAVSLLADYLHGFAYGMECNTTQQVLTVEHADGPLRLCLSSFQACSG